MCSCWCCVYANFCGPVLLFILPCDRSWLTGRPGVGQRCAQRISFIGSSASPKLAALPEGMLAGQWPKYLFHPFTVGVTVLPFKLTDYPPTFATWYLGPIWCSLKTIVPSRIPTRCNSFFLPCCHIFSARCVRAWHPGWRSRRTRWESPVHLWQTSHDGSSFDMLDFDGFHTSLFHSFPSITNPYKSCHTDIFLWICQDPSLVHYSSLKSNSWAYHIMTYQYFSIFLNMKHNIDRLSYEFSYWQTV